MVIVWNILTGIADPVTGEHVWGGQEIAPGDLPASEWFAAMNECDRIVGGAAQFRCGLEIPIGPEELGGITPADAVDVLLQSCDGRIAEMGGVYHIRVGAPGIPVYAYTDDDVIVTSPEELDPFPGLDEAYNAVVATHPNPADGWQPRATPIRENAAWLAEDGGRRNVLSLDLPAVFDGAQAQRLGDAALKDGRRFRRHNQEHPPEARRLGPLDTVAWTSARNGFDAKWWEVGLIEDLPGGNHALALREVDPDDYDFDEGDLLDVDGGYVTRPDTVVVAVPDFDAEPAIITDTVSRQRKGGARLLWNRNVDGATSLLWSAELVGGAAQTPGQGVVFNPDGAISEAQSITIGGEAVTVAGEAIVVGGEVTDLTPGTALVSDGLVEGATYDFSAIFQPQAGRVRSEKVRVTIPVVGLDWIDFNAALTQDLAEAEAAAQDALDGYVDVAARAAALEDNADRSLVIRQGATYLQIVELSDPDAPYEGAFLFRGGDVIAPGTLVAGEVLVGEVGGNLIDNGKFVTEDFTGWYNVDPEMAVVEKDPASGTTAIRDDPGALRRAVHRRRAVARHLDAGGPAGESRRPVHAELRLRRRRVGPLADSEVPASAGRTRTGGGRPGRHLRPRHHRHHDRLGRSATTSFTAPAGAVKLRYAIFERLAGGTGNTYVTNVELIRKRDGGILITDDSLTGAQMIKTPGGDHRQRADRRRDHLERQDRKRRDHATQGRGTGDHVAEFGDGRRQHVRERGCRNRMDDGADPGGDQGIRRRASGSVVRGI